MAARNEAEEPLYVISVAAKLLEVHPQTLRLYERLGLIAPARSQSNIRLFSQRDVERVRRIQHLTQDMGVNLAGVEVILDLLDKLDRQRQEMERRVAQMRREMEQRLARMRAELEAHFARAAAQEAPDQTQDAEPCAGPGRDASARG